MDDQHLCQPHPGLPGTRGEQQHGDDKDDDDNNNNNNNNRKVVMLLKASAAASLLQLVGRRRQRMGQDESRLAGADPDRLELLLNLMKLERVLRDNPAGEGSQIDHAWDADDCSPNLALRQNGLVVSFKKTSSNHLAHRQSRLTTLIVTSGNLRKCE